MIVASAIKRGCIASEADWLPCACSNLGLCNLTGSIPSEWLTNTSMQSLLHLDLSNNRQLTGTLPSFLLMPKLQVRQHRHRSAALGAWTTPLLALAMQRVQEVKQL